MPNKFHIVPWNGFLSTSIKHNLGRMIRKCMNLQALIIKNNNNKTQLSRGKAMFNSKDIISGT